MSYHAFAAGASAYGIRAAASAARTYGVPLAVCLSYLRRYLRADNQQRKNYRDAR